MPGTPALDQDYIDACSSRSETQIAVFRELSLAARDLDDGSSVENALDWLEPEYFNNMLLVLDGYASFPPGSGAVFDEVSLLARSLRENGGTVVEADGLGATAGILGLRPGDSVRLTLHDYARLSNAYFRDLEVLVSREQR